MDEVVCCRSYSNCDCQPVEIVDGQAQLWYSLRIGVRTFIIRSIHQRHSAIILRHDLWNHCYADDTQVYFYFKPGEVNSLTPKLSACIDDLRGWMQSNRLKLNADMTECIWVTNRQRKSTSTAPNLSVGGSIIVHTKEARNLGIFFDSKIDLKLHISNICRTCYLQPR